MIAFCNSISSPFSPIMFASIYPRRLRSPPSPRSSSGKVYTLHFVGLHFMIVGARCQESIGDDPCSYRDWGTSMITLYVCSFIKVSAQMSLVSIDDGNISHVHGAVFFICGQALSWPLVGYI